MFFQRFFLVTTFQEVSRVCCTRNVTQNVLSIDAEEELKCHPQVSDAGDDVMS